MSRVSGPLRFFMSFSDPSSSMALPLLVVGRPSGSGLVSWDGRAAVPVRRFRLAVEARARARTATKARNGTLPPWLRAAIALWCMGSSQPGAPSVLSTWSARAALPRWPGSICRIAPPTHRTAHAKGNHPATANSATPVARSSRCGHTARARTAYRSTAPGAPVTSEACPEARPPKPSPNHQIPADQATDPTMAGRTRRRNRNPTPRASWPRAKVASKGAECAAMMWAKKSTGAPTQPG